LTPSATTGSITLTASAAAFNAGHVGTHIHVNGGFVTITGYTSATVLAGTVTTTLTGTGADATWSEWAWSGGRGYPRTATFHENRLVFGGTRDAPETLFGSVTGDFFNFDDKTGGTVIDSSAFKFTLSTDEIHIIRDLKSQRDLEIFTSQASTA